MSTSTDINAQTTGPRLLLIDDEPAILASFALAFGDQGWTVTTAESGEEGLDLYRPGAFDLVITDKNLPGMSGVAVVTEIRQIDSVVTIMMLTGFGSTSSAVDTLNAGVDAYEEKPVRNVIHLTARAEAAIKRRKKLADRAAELTPSPFEALILTANQKNAELIARELTGKVDRITFAKDLHEAQCVLEVRPVGLVIAEEGLSNLCDAIEEIKENSECPPVAVLGQDLSLDAIMRMVETGVAACIILPIGSAPFADRLSELVKNLRQKNSAGSASL